MTPPPRSPSSDSDSGSGSGSDNYNDSLPSPLLSGLPDSVNGIGIERGDRPYIKDPREPTPKSKPKLQLLTKTPTKLIKEFRKITTDDFWEMATTTKRPTTTTTTTSSSSSSSSSSFSSRNRKNLSNLTTLYPVQVEELTRSDWKLLTEVLHIESTSNTKYIIKALIQDLPSNLSRSFVMQLVPKSIAPAAKLCDVHKGMNAHAIAHIFELLQWEVGFHLDVMLDYPRYDKEVGRELKSVINRLRAMQGMWTEDDEMLDARRAWTFQENECQACSLARAGSNTGILRDLRVTLLSRTRTRKEHRVPRLVPFVEGCMNHHMNSLELFHVSGELAYAFKKARKAAVRHHLKRRRHRRESRRDEDYPRERRHRGRKSRRRHRRDESESPRLPRIPEIKEEPETPTTTKSTPRDNKPAKVKIDTRSTYLRNWLVTEPEWIGGDRGSRLSPRPRESAAFSSRETRNDNRRRNVSTEHMHLNDSHDDDNVVEVEEEQIIDYYGDRDENAVQVSRSPEGHANEVRGPLPYVPPQPSRADTNKESQGRTGNSSDSNTLIPETRQSQGETGNSSDSNTLIPDPLFSGRKSSVSPYVEDGDDRNSEHLPREKQRDHIHSDVEDDDDDDSIRSTSPPPKNPKFSPKNSNENWI